MQSGHGRYRIEPWGVGGGGGCGRKGVSHPLFCKSLVFSPGPPSFLSLAVQESRREPSIFSHVTGIMIERMVERVV